MEILLFGATIAITGIGVYATWKAHNVEEELNRYARETSEQLNKGKNLLWEQTRRYSSDLETEQKAVLAQAKEYREHHDRLMQALDQEHQVSKATIAKLTEYINSSKAELKNEIDSTFARYKGKVTQLEDDSRDIHSSIRELRSKKADVENLNQAIAELNEAIEEDFRDLNERVDALGVHLNKATEDRLAKGERAILEHLRLGMKQKDIAKKLSSTEARVSQVKKKLLKLGLLTE